MLKFKFSLFSSAVLIFGFVLSITPIKAMEKIDSKSENPSVTPKKKTKKKIKKTILQKYPLTPEGNEKLKAAARNGNDSAFDEMVRRCAEKFLTLDEKNELKDFFELPDLKERILTKPGYLIVLLHFFKDQYLQHFPMIYFEIQEEAKKNNIIAQFSMGWMHDYGHYVSKDMRLAIEWYIKAERLAIAQYTLGKLYQREGDSTKAVEWFTKAGNQGDANAQFNLGNMYRLGLGIKKNNVEALKWLMLSGQGEYNETTKNYIKQHLILNERAPAKEGKDAHPLSNLENVKYHLAETQAEHELQLNLNDPNGRYSAHVFSMPVLQENYQKLSAFGSKLLSILNILEKIKTPGFMITAATLSRDITDNLNNNISARYFSINNFKGKSYLTVGSENCVLVEEFLAAIKEIDGGMKIAIQALGTLKFLYNPFNDLTNELLHLHEEGRALCNKSAKTDEEETQLIQLTTQFKTKMNALEEMKKTPTEKQDLERLQEDEEKLGKAYKIIKSFVRSVSIRDDEFSDKYSYLK